MKFSDDYSAKYGIWARQNKVVRLPEPQGVPRFGSRKFNSYREFNAWKRDLLEQIALQGGLRWTK